MPWSSGRAFATAVEYVTTRVLSSVASTVFTKPSDPMRLPAGPSPYFRMVFIVHAASFAVSGWPSDHFAFGTVWNVHVSPSAEVSHDCAKSGLNSNVCESYCTSCG